MHTNNNIFGQGIREVNEISKNRGCYASNTLSYSRLGRFFRGWVALLILLFLATALPAQTTMQRTWLEISGGVMRYGGSMPTVDTKAAAIFGLHYEITDKIHVQLQFTASEAGGADSALDNQTNLGNDGRSSQYYFKTNINEFSLTGSYDFFNLNAGYRFTPYVVAGAGFYNFKPYQVVEFNNAQGALRKENRAMRQVEPFSNWQISLPVGVGVKWGLSANTQLKLEGKYRVLMNSYLDNYIADGGNDHYFSVALGFVFRLAKVSGSGGRTRGGRNCNCPPVY